MHPGGHLPPAMIHISHHDTFQSLVVDHVMSSLVRWEFQMISDLQLEPSTICVDSLHFWTHFTFKHVYGLLSHCNSLKSVVQKR